ncbi:histidine phosphatase family protein [Arsenicicoccus bolidensis]|uniref:Histidine phosphatase family protein n=1 Tax=Arsenicicoccus bolidensis TaxID=229480 RepID=A0ABS9Q6P4_9MICO|nr:histidine phosphatase family protein [Arsenicicoccus bolidensis]MCG7323546.1 histidine phosphatase family protein [Arsenicicoccus bolidensis]
MDLFVIRHGQSENNKLYAETGSRAGRTPDSELSELGHEQARRLAEAVSQDRSHLDVEVLYTALTHRCLQTVAPLADALGLEPIGRTDLGEVGGLYAAHPATNVRRPYPGLSTQEMHDIAPSLTLPDDVEQGSEWDGGFEEEHAEAQRRAATVLADLASHHGDRATIGILTHQHFGQLLIGAAAGIGEAGRRFELSNSSVTALRHEDGEWRVLWVNRVRHLDSDQINA